MISLQRSWAIIASLAILLASACGHPRQQGLHEDAMARDGYIVEIPLDREIQTAGTAEGIQESEKYLEDYEEANLLRGLVLGYGPVARQIPGIRDNRALDVIIGDPLVRAAVIQVYEQIIETIERDHSEFLGAFAEDILSRDHLRIQRALHDAALLISELAQDSQFTEGSAGVEARSEDGMCIVAGTVLAVYYVLFVVAHNQVAVNAAVFATLALQTAIANNRGVFQSQPPVPEQDTVPMGGTSVALMSTQIIDQIANREVRVWNFRPGLEIAAEGRYTKAGLGLTLGDFSGDGSADRFYYETKGRNCGFSFGTGNYFDCSGFAFVQPKGGRPFVGDFDNNGHDDLFWRFSSHQETWYFYNAGNNRLGMEIKVRYEVDALSQHHVFVGDFDGDQRDDIFWYGRGSTPDWILFGLSNRSYKKLTTSVGGSYYEPIAGDFVGHHYTDDVLWYRPGHTSHPIWNLKRTQNQTIERFPDISLSTSANTYRVISGDYNGDLRDDMYFHEASGNWAASDRLLLWGSGDTYSVTSYLVPGSFYPVQGDITGDALRLPDMVFWPNSMPNWPSSQ